MQEKKIESEPYLSIKKDKRYESNDFLEQYTIVTANELKTYNLWNHAFTKTELEAGIIEAGFESIEFFGGVAGEALNRESKTISAICKK